MICMNCERNKEEALLIKLPVEIVYENHELHILGNIEDNEYMCLICVGYQYDEVIEREMNREAQ